MTPVPEGQFEATSAIDNDFQSDASPFFAMLSSTKTSINRAILGELNTYKKENGVIQASPIWIKPIFMGDIESGQLSVENLLVQRTIRRDTLLKWVDDQSERKVEELIRRGR